MSLRLWLRLAEILLPLTLATTLFVAWRADRRGRAQLAADLATAQQALAQADARQHDRDAQLLQTLAAVAAEKRSITTPAQIVRELPQEIPLPAPIVLESKAPAKVSGAVSGLSTAPTAKPAPPDTDQASKPPETEAVIPAADLKPLYDFTLDCQACQAKLAAAQGDLADEKAKGAVLARERDEAIRAAKGGSVLRRVVRAAKWFAIGAAAGAIAAKLRH